MIKDTKKYTIKHIMEQLALLEEHFKEFIQGEEAVFCLDCELKHILTLSGFAQECIGFRCEPENIIIELRKWADDLAFRLKDMNREEIKEAQDKARYFRKELEKYFLYGSEGGVAHLKEV